jgi:hypothetical protein
MKPHFEIFEGFFEDMNKDIARMKKDITPEQERTYEISLMKSLSVTKGEDPEIVKEMMLIASMAGSANSEWISADDLTAVIQSTVYVNFHALNKRPVFYFDDILLSKLYYTDVVKVHADNIRLPFNVIYLDLASLKLTFKGKPIIGIYVKQYLNRQLSFLIVTDHLYTIAWNILLFDKDGEAVIDKLEIDSDIGVDLLKCVINCLLYINIVDYRKSFVKGKDLSKIQNQTKLRKLKQGKETYNSYYSMTYIKPPVVNKDGSSDNKWIIGSRFMVRGHWRNQAFGKGFSEHKVIWIEPYIKGEGDEKSQQYKAVP